MRKLIKTEQVSTFQKTLKEKLNVHDDHVEKLVTDLTDKEKYFIHYKNLQLCLQLGMKIKDNKIHKVLSYKAVAWLKDYIQSNSELRQYAKSNKDKNGNKKSKDDFMSNVLKINNNGVFGKQMENVRNRVNIDLVKNSCPECNNCNDCTETYTCDKCKKCTNDKCVKSMNKYTKLTSHPTYKRRTIINRNLVAVHRHKKEIQLNKPILNGFIILELSKYLMYNFYYNVIKKRYGDKVKLLFTDTDSLCLEIQSEDIYEDIKEMDEHFDCSEYPETHMLYNTKHQAIPGLFKDERGSHIITEFIGLRSKLYSYKYEDVYDENNPDSLYISLKDLFNEKSYYIKNVGKGIKKCVLNKKIHTDDYKYVLDNNVVIRKDMNLIKSKLHKVHTETINKIALSAFDNKRFILDDGINELAFGHYKIDLINKSLLYFDNETKELKERL